MLRPFFALLRDVRAVAFVLVSEAYEVRSYRLLST